MAWWFAGAVLLHDLVLFPLYAAGDRLLLLALPRTRVPLVNHVRIPVLGSGLALLMFLSTWNQFRLAIVLIEDPDKRTMAGALQSFVGKYSTDLVLLNAGAVLIIAPTIVVFLLLQRHFVKALLQGASFDRI